MLCSISEDSCAPGTAGPNNGGKERPAINNKNGLVNPFVLPFHSVQEQCFYQLRTIQQLGYVAFCHNIVNEGVGSFEVSLS